MGIQFMIPDALPELLTRKDASSVLVEEYLKRYLIATVNSWGNGGPVKKGQFFAHVAFLEYLLSDQRIQRLIPVQRKEMIAKTYNQNIFVRSLDRQSSSTIYRCSDIILMGRFVKRYSIRKSNF